MAANPAAAAIDQASDPVATPRESAIPIFRPALIDVSAMANVAGPGLALATNDATRMRGRLT